MSYSTRVLAILESELTQRLSFSFRLAPAPARRESGAIRARDLVEFVVSVRNDASFPFRALHGSIDPTPYTMFKPLSFSVARIEPGESCEIGTLQALVAELPARGTALDQLAAVSLSASVDLSAVVFHEWDKPLTYAAPAPPIEAGHCGIGAALEDGRAAVRAQGTARADESLLRGPY